jgi:hypothetical protein
VTLSLWRGTTVPDSSKRLPAANPAVIFRALTEGAVLFSTEDEVYYGLNSVGAKVWELLTADDRDFDDVCVELARTYPGVDMETIKGDVTELLEDLRANRLVLARRPGEPRAENLDRATAEGRDA